MFGAIKKMIKDCGTGADGETHDVGRWLWMIGVLSYIAFSGYSLFKGQPWHPQEFGLGFGGVLAGGGAGIGLKAKTEPQQ